ncbi:Nodule Cysteine-Rich (NCR) secreted peptide [Medicago truncatula]|uniref:Nodule Cysteine-Rich (NCR) secreted peptide n=1 Tax=Medicago truncatula TaxID=3880 RepID=A0A072V7Q8_MEDTR|nr:Nodule Cysteine-Rich (NCR) secreted peptide [Medicago truncatula]
MFKHFSIVRIMMTVKTKLSMCFLGLRNVAITNVIVFL